MYKDDSKKAFGMDWSDNRPLAKLQFAIEAPTEERTARAERVRALLARAGVAVADDIGALGCTGLIATASFEECVFVRENIAGAGTGLPCFVPPTRFCLVHNVIGGLQEKQRPLFPENVERISRELTEAEAMRVVSMEELRRTKGADVIERIRNTAERLNSGESVVEEFEEGFQEPNISPSPISLLPEAEKIAEKLAAEALPTVRARLKAFPVDDRGRTRLCGEHTELNWCCRECVAQEILNGAYEPPLLMAAADEDGLASPEGIDRVDGKSVDERVTELNTTGAHAIAVYARVARWSRRLARE